MDSLMPDPPYFYKDLSRDDAEVLLWDRGCIDGMYLLRTSQTKDANYILSLCFHKSVLHYPIKEYPDGLLRIRGLPQESFTTLIQLVSSIKGVPCKPLIPCNKPIEQLMPDKYHGISNAEIEKIIQAKAVEWELEKNDLKELITNKDSEFYQLVMKTAHELQPWFHGKITREEAEKIIAESGHKDGKFLIRERDDCSYVLCVSHNGQVKHYKIDILPSGEFGIQDGPRFKYLVSLVTHYYVFSDGLWCALRDACPKQLNHQSKENSESTDSSNVLSNESQASNHTPSKFAPLSPTDKQNLNCTFDAANLSDVSNAKKHVNHLNIPGTSLLHHNNNVRTDENQKDMESSSNLADSKVPISPTSASSNEQGLVKLTVDLLNDSSFLKTKPIPSPRLKLNYDPKNLLKPENVNIAEKFSVSDKKSEELISSSKTPDDKNLAECAVTKKMPNKSPLNFGPLIQELKTHFVNPKPLEVKLDEKPNDSTVEVEDSASKEDPIYEVIDADYEETNGNVSSPSVDNSQEKGNNNNIPQDEELKCQNLSSAESATSVINKTVNQTKWDDPAEENKGAKGCTRKPTWTKEESEHHFRTIRRYRKNPMNINHKNIFIQEKLGSGNFGEVYKAAFKSDNIEVLFAVKMLKKSSIDGAKMDIMKEARIMTDLDHQNIVRLIGICESDSLMLVMELAPLGPMNAYLKKHSDVPIQDVISLMLQVALGMEYLEAKQFVHRDLAARNVLLVNENFAKISDFGMSKALGLDKDYYKVEPRGKLPLKWYAPECIYYFKFSSKSDVWSFGITFWEAVSYGEKPYQGMLGQDILKMFSEDRRLPKPPKCPSEIYKVLLECWQYTPEQRPNFAYLKERLKQYLED